MSNSKSVISYFFQADLQAQTFYFLTYLYVHLYSQTYQTGGGGFYVIELLFRFSIHTKDFSENAVKYGILYQISERNNTIERKNSAVLRLQ